MFRNGHQNKFPPFFATLAVLIVSLANATGATNRISKIANPANDAALKLDAAGNPVIAFRGSASLQLAHCGDRVCANGTTIETLDTGSIESKVAVVLGDSGNPIVSYFFGSVDKLSGELRIASCGDPNCASGASITTADSGLEGLGLFMVLDSAGNPVISYSGGGGVKLLHCGNPSCTAGNSIQVIDGIAGEPDTGLVLDGAGRPVVAYVGSGTSPKIKLVHCKDPNCSSWTETSVDSAGITNFDNVAVVLDAAGNPVLSYYNLGQRIAHCGNRNCTANNAITTVDMLAFDEGTDTSLLLDGKGNPVVSYEINNGGKGQLTILRCGDANCSTGNTYAHPDTSNDNGQHSSLQLDAQGRPVASYIRFDQRLNSFLYVVHCGSTSCSQ